MKIEDKLEYGKWKDSVKELTMPKQMQETLKELSGKTKSKANYMRNARMAIPAACMIFMLTTAGMTVHAVYMNTHLRVFLEQDITVGQISQIEEELTQIEGISACRFVDGDTAWREFSTAYLTPELTESFTANPLSESANFEVTISLKTDIESLKDTVAEIDGVRRILLFSEEQ